ncbi:hypothetical protein OCF84_21040 (plasmid) [Shewanella xiamenensis]|uniref:Uncharacterized protein n=1 Tax=Shewanella xiamenensis TaxID=332186 RepID=A0ABT6UE18_9GAMM|nr:hypothetical protein [Shewanella xiamenensis]MDI5832636.1 hypothetical protein [Shewanella xiamenensis]WHF58006.1 hypothetical protein OCF84_21040 [Shewanella xiamenensis]
MKYIDDKNLTELDRTWIRKFKASKCMDTLDIQVEGAERKVNSDSSIGFKQKSEILNAINTAYCIREQELTGF